MTMPLSPSRATALQLSAVRIHGHRFTAAKRGGYNQAEVHANLGRAADDFARLHTALAARDDAARPKEDLHDCRADHPHTCRQAPDAPTPPPFPRPDYPSTERAGDRRRPSWDAWRIAYPDPATGQHARAVPAADGTASGMVHRAQSPARAHRASW